MSEPLPRLINGTRVTAAHWNATVDRVNELLMWQRFDTWFELDLAPGWTNFRDSPGNTGSTQPRLAWTMLPGVVWIRGVLRRTGGDVSGESTIATLPMMASPTGTYPMGIVPGLGTTNPPRIDLREGAITMLTGSRADENDNLIFITAGFPLS